MASQAMHKISEAIRQANQNAPSGPLDIQTQRDQMETVQGKLRIPDDVSIEHLEIAGCKARFTRTPGVREDRCILYLHGGGYIMGSLDTHQELMGRIARTTNTQVLSLEYRLAPEHPYPAAVEDAVAAYLWLIEQGTAPENLLVAGDSAGGGLVLAMLFALREQGAPLPAAAWLLSPWIDLTASGDSIHSRAEADPSTSADALAPMAAHYHASHSPTLPGISPLFGDLSELPPLLVQVGDAEILLDDSTRLHQRAIEVGVSSTLHIFDAAFHVFQAMPSLPESAQALEEASAFFEKALSNTP